MARALWTGAVSFGLVNVPVALFSGVRDLDVRFRQLHEKDGARIDVRRFCGEEDRKVPYEQIAHGYDLDGEQVVLTDEELAAAEPRKTRTIDIEAFVDLEDVDPIFFDHPYLLAPTGGSEGNLRAYRLLVEVLGGTERAGLGRFVMRTKEHLVLLRERDQRLALTTMRFHDEVRPTKGIPTGGRKLAKQQLETATQLIEALSADWDPSRYRDCRRERLLDIVERKRKGGTITAPKPGAEPAGPPPDLMSALKESLDRARGGGPGGGGDRDEADGLDDLSRDELYERAQQADVPGRSSMSKDELIDALSR